VPHDDNGRPTRHSITAEGVFKFRSEQYLKKFNIRQAEKKGKNPVADQEEPQPEKSGSSASPLTVLAPLRALSLESSPSPADSPAADVSSENPSQAGPSCTLKFSHIEVPSSQHHRQPSTLDISGRSLKDRVSELERKMDDIDRRLKAAGL